jgi:hypothetical protein
MTICRQLQCPNECVGTKALCDDCTRTARPVCKVCYDNAHNDASEQELVTKLVHCKRFQDRRHHQRNQGQDWCGDKADETAKRVLLYCMRCNQYQRTDSNKNLCARCRYWATIHRKNSRNKKLLLAHEESAKRMQQAQEQRAKTRDADAEDCKLCVEKRLPDEEELRLSAANEMGPMMFVCNAKHRANICQGCQMNALMTAHEDRNSRPRCALCRSGKCYVVDYCCVLKECREFYFCFCFLLQRHERFLTSPTVEGRTNCLANEICRRR